MTTSIRPQAETAFTSDTGCRQPWWKQLASSSWLHLPLLLAIVACCFGRTLGSYFLADDFSEVRYIDRIFHGEPQLIWSNFIGSYMQNPSIQVLRPWMLMTQVVDYFFWQSNSLGFYLSNLLYYAGDTALLYLIIRQLTATWTPLRSGMAAFFSAALFATNPLHCESVSWMVGRVDVDCCFYYLLSVCLFLHARHRPISAVATSLKLAGLLSFWLALFTKEMAILLPLLVTAVVFLQPDKQCSLRTRLKESIRFSLPLWLSLPVYFTWRFLALGTLLGGYTGTIGASQSAAAFSRWLDPDTISRIFFPFSAAVFPLHNPYALILGNCLLLLTALIALRVLASQLPFRLAAILAIWAITCIAPIYRLWGLGLNLEGARFYFFLSLVLSAFWPLMLLQPGKSSGYISPALQQKLLVIATTTLLVMTAVQGRAAYATNVLWVHAGKEVAAFLHECEKLSSQLPAGSKAVVLGIPDNHGGAHQILNAHTVEMMLRPPFTKTDISDRFLVFHPLWFGHSELINASRFKHCLQDPTVSAVLVWDSNHKIFHPLHLTADTGIPDVSLPAQAAISWHPSSAGQLSYQLEQTAADLRNLSDGDGLQVEGLQLNPLAADFLEFDISDAAATQQPLLSFNGQPSINCIESITTITTTNGSTKWNHVRLRPSSHWRWFSSQKIRSLRLQFQPADQVLVRNLRLTSANSLVPRLNVIGTQASGSGVYTVVSNPITLKFDASGIAGCKSLQLEISHPNYFFEHCGKTTSALATASTLPTSANRGTVVLTKDNFPTHGLYQIRALGLDAKGKKLGEYSDVITIEH